MINSCNFGEIPPIGWYCENVTYLNPPVTLKKKSTSPKSNQLLSLSQWYIHASVVKFHPLVQEISWVQEVGRRRRRRRHPHWNQYVPHPHLWWRKIMMSSCSEGMHSFSLRPDDVLDFLLLSFIIFYWTKCSKKIWFCMHPTLLLHFAVNCSVS